jgi:release factor glutamine methyltransferase
MTALDKIKEAKEFLETSGVDDAGKEAEMIISHCLGTDRVIIYRDNPRIPENIIQKIDEYLKRRTKKEPLQYIFGHTEFYGLKIKTGPGVLIPRPETELLVEETIKIISNFSPESFRDRISKFKILDLCTGSGCLALVLAREFPEAQVYGTDTSEVAIRYAKENAYLNEIKNVKFVTGSLFDPVKELKFDLIISNPPYIKRSDIKSLQPEIKDWEPVEALDGGEDGLDYYRAIIPEARNYLKEGGYLLLELGMSQSDEVKEMSEDAGFKDISLMKDFAGIERVLVAKKEIASSVLPTSSQ